MFHSSHPQNCTQSKIFSWFFFSLPHIQHATCFTILQDNTFYIFYLHKHESDIVLLISLSARLTIRTLNKKGKLFLLRVSSLQTQFISLGPPDRLGPGIIQSMSLGIYGTSMFLACAGFVFGEDKRGACKVLYLHSITSAGTPIRKIFDPHLLTRSCSVVTNRRQLLYQAAPSGRQLKIDYNWQHPGAEWTSNFPE